MVHKTSHRGVHSGNTLRAFNSRYSRRYHNQACIVSRVSPELLNELAGEKTDKKHTAFSNVAVNVALSLNKQSRWLLPSALIRQIESDDIALSGLTVSLLERHKLKSPSSCVSFHSNKGDVRRIQPRNGRYFSFNFPTADGKSRRAIRREQRELQSQIKRNEQGKCRDVEVFTEQGQVKMVNEELGESEVRYEIFYPSPARSSISHNPKYIKQDVSMAPGEGGDYVQHGKPRKQHRGKQRKRMSLKDIDVCDLPSFNIHFHSDFATASEIAENEESLVEDDTHLNQKSTECLLSLLIEKAERLQNLVGVKKSRRKKKSGKELSCPQKDEKSHIVYVLDSAEDTDDDPTLGSRSSLTRFPEMPAEFTRVVIPSEDVTVASLKDCFGERYFEVACRPRRFVLDTTSNIRDLLKKRDIPATVADTTSDAISYLIFVHDGFYDDKHDVYKILLNSKLQPRLLAVQISTSEHQQDLYKGTVMDLISRTVDFVDGIITGLKEQHHFSAVPEKALISAKDRQLKHHLGSADTFLPSVQRLFGMGSAISCVLLPSLEELLEEEPAFCDVCYSDVSLLLQDSIASTALLKCGHRVCDNCWSFHFHCLLDQGFARVTCPGYDCHQEADLGVLLSIVTLDTVEKLLRRQEDVRIGASPTEKWCPNQSCGRVLRLQASSGSGKCELQQDVVCACGAHVCFQCLLPAHWPASCQQAEDYRSNLATAVFPDRLAEVYDDGQDERTMPDDKKSMIIEGKRCPRCKEFVTKEGRGTQMECVCGQRFCWYCVKPGDGHPARSCVDSETEKKLTTTVTVNHREAKKCLPDLQKEQERTQLASRRQRMSLMEKAVEHRKHGLKNHQYVKVTSSLARLVSAAASKDKALAQHVLSICSGTYDTDKMTPTVTDVKVSRPSSVLESVTSFLKNVVRGKQELHEVVEYSLVLLKDMPDSVLRQRALRISEDLGAFCSFIQSIFDAWGGSSSHGSMQEAVKAVTRLSEIQRWINSALATHVTTIKKIRHMTKARV